MRLARKFSRRGHGLVVTFDADEIVPNDPGAGTPVMVATTCGKYMATFHCARWSGELDCGTYLLDEAQLSWLSTLEETVYNFEAQHAEAL